MLPVIVEEWYLRHGYDCPANHGGSVEIGSAKPETYITTQPGQGRLPVGTVEFRDRSTNALLASASTLAGTQLPAVGACKINITPDALRPYIVIRVFNIGTSLAR